MTYKYWAIVADYGHGDITTYGRYRYKSAAKRALAAMIDPSTGDYDYMADRLVLRPGQITIEQDR